MAQNLIADLSLLPEEPLLMDIRIVIPNSTCVERAARWITETFSRRWARQFQASATHLPPRCWIALKDEQIVGFAGWDGTAPGLFGPMGVSRQERGKGIGKALLLACLWDMAKFGYKYAIIWRAGPIEFYAKAVGAVSVPTFLKQVA